MIYADITMIFLDNVLSSYDDIVILNSDINAIHFHAILVDIVICYDIYDLISPYVIS